MTFTLHHRATWVAGEYNRVMNQTTQARPVYGQSLQNWQSEVVAFEINSLYITDVFDLIFLSASDRVIAPRHCLSPFNPSPSLSGYPFA
jgi:hypothetical protein